MADRGVVGIAQKGVLDHHTGLAACFEDLDEVLQEQRSCFSSA
jgi:hypothetical protein